LPLCKFFCVCVLMRVCVWVFCILERIPLVTHAPYLFTLTHTFIVATWCTGLNNKHIHTQTRKHTHLHTYTYKLKFIDSLTMCAASTGGWPYS
jgi:hypothetical protein